jgi:hypothetical protein
MHGRDQEVPLTAHECASRIGLTVRALRLYQRHGLISPRRTANPQERPRQLITL